MVSIQTIQYETTYQYPNYLKCTLLPKQLEVSKWLFWYLENSDLSRLLKITHFLFFPKLLLCRLSHFAYVIHLEGPVGYLSRILWFSLIQGAGTELPFSCQAGSKQQEQKALPFFPTSPAFTMAGFPVIHHSRQHSIKKKKYPYTFTNTLTYTYTETKMSV